MLERESLVNSLRSATIRLFTTSNHLIFTYGDAFYFQFIHFLRSSFSQWCTKSCTFRFLCWQCKFIGLTVWSKEVMNEWIDLFENVCVKIFANVFLQLSLSYYSPWCPGSFYSWPQQLSDDGLPLWWIYTLFDDVNTGCTDPGTDLCSVWHHSWYGILWAAERCLWNEQRLVTDFNKGKQNGAVLQ